MITPFIIWNMLPPIQLLYVLQSQASKIGRYLVIQTEMFKYI